MDPDYLVPIVEHGTPTDAGFRRDVVLNQPGILRRCSHTWIEWADCTDGSSETGGADVTPVVLCYVNRISDLLFAMARRANKEAGVADVPWIGKKA